jgi:HK97 family phage portal protein
VTLLGRLIEARASIEDVRLPLTAQRLVEWFAAGNKTHAGINVNPKTAFGKSVAVYRAVSLVAGAIAPLPLMAYRAGPERTPYNSPFIAEHHWEMTNLEVIERSLWSLLGWGDSYHEKIRDATGAVRYIDPINPAAITPKRVERTADNPTGKVFEVRYDNGQLKTFTPQTILHVPGPGYDGARGLSPIGVARQAIGLALAAETYGAKLYGNGTLQQGFLSTDAEIPDEPTADRIKARWKAKMTGLDNAHDVAVLDRGLKFTQLSINPADAQFIESRTFQNIDIAMLYGIPPHLLSQVTKSTSWGTGIEQQNMGLVLFTLMPWLSRLEQRLAKECLPRPILCQFDTDELLRGDEAARASAASIWINNGIRSRNEVRRREKLKPVDGGDTFLIQGAMVPLDEEGVPMVPETPAEAGEAQEEAPARAIPEWLLSETQPVHPYSPNGNGTHAVGSKS